MAASELTTGRPPLDLAHLAASIPVPVDAFGRGRAYCQADQQPGSRLSDGYPSGLGGRTTYRVAFALDGGRRREPVGPVFERPCGAIRLAAAVNGESIAGGETGSPEPPRPRLCGACEKPLPAGSRPHRRRFGPAQLTLNLVPDDKVAAASVSVAAAESEGHGNDGPTD